MPRLEVIDEKFTPEYNSAELYADDVLSETDYSFKKGTLVITVANDDDEKDAFLMGNTIVDGEVVKNIEDTAPEFGYGHIVKKQVNGVKMFKVEVFPRIRVTKITTDAKTRGENVEFGTTTIEAIVLPLDDGRWEWHSTFDDEWSAMLILEMLIGYWYTPE